MHKKILFMGLILVSLIAACTPSQAPTQDVEAIVQATFQALTAQAPQATPTPQMGGISGTLSFPSEGIPPLLVVAFNTLTGQYYWAQTAQNQSTYQIDNMPAGKYTVFAYALPDGKMVAAYDQFYVCGLHQGCNDMSLIEVDVQPGVVTTNVDPGDWYGDPSQWPPMPNDPGIPGVDAGTINVGSIAGKLSYPSSFIPSMVVVAHKVGAPDYYYVVTNENTSTYQIDNLPAGNYYIVAYVDGGGYAGGYSQMVPCGLTAECTDHTLVPVAVTGGQVTGGIDPGDWYAPPNAFPAYPLP